MSVAGIQAGQEGILRIGEGVDTMKVALVKAEEAALLAEQVSHRWRRVALVIVAVGLVVVAVGVLRGRRSRSDDAASGDA